MNKNKPAFVFRALRVVVAVKEFALEQLDRYDGKDELKEHVDNHYVEDILQGIYDTVKYGLEKKTFKNNWIQHTGKKSNNL